MRKTAETTETASIADSGHVRRGVVQRAATNLTFAYEQLPEATAATNAKVLSWTSGLAGCGVRRPGLVACFHQLSSDPCARTLLSGR